MNHTIHIPDRKYQNGQNSFLYFLHLLVKSRKFIIVSTFLVSVVIAGYSLILPKSFEAASTILPPTNDQSGSLSSLLGGLPLGIGGIGGFDGVSESSRLLAILDSRTVMNNVVNKFNLMSRYGKLNMEESIKSLRDNSFSEIQEDGTILVKSWAHTKYFSSPVEEDEARNLASDMTNFRVEELDRVNKQLKSKQAHLHRLFLEKRYDQNKSDLYDSEDSLRVFQEKYGAIALEFQTEAAIAAAADLKVDIIANEINLGVLSRYLGSENPEIQSVEAQLFELRGKMKELMIGKPLADSTTSPEFSIFPTFSAVPELGVTFARLTREVLIQSTLLEFLITEYEQAKIQEARDTPTLQTLDYAVPPVKRSSPRRALLVISFAIIWIFLCMIGVLVKQYYLNIKQINGDEYQIISEISQTLKSDTTFLRKMFVKKKV